MVAGYSFKELENQPKRQDGLVTGLLPELHWCCKRNTNTRE